MARKPVKKRKQQRAPVKRKPKSFKPKAASVKPPKPFNPIFNLKIGTHEDPFFIHPETIPDGVALQWVATDAESEWHMSDALSNGWCLVDGKDVKGLVLMWAPREVAKAQTDANINRAQKQMAEARALFGMNDGRASQYHGRVPMVSDAFMVSSNYGTIPSDAPPIDIDVTIQFRVSARWQDAAAALGLDVTEYTRRRLIMEPTVLGPCSPAFLYENVNISRNVYEPVQLSITRKD